MKIGVISDTHIPGGAMEIPPNVTDAFEGVEMILHAGNIFIPSVLDWLENIAPVKAAGSSDRDQHCRNDERTASTQVVKVGDQTIGVVHDLMVPGFGGYIYPGSLSNNFTYDESTTLIPHDIFDTEVDIVIFGHTCTALAEEHNGILFINPGSPTLRNQLMKIGTVAVLDVNAGSRHVNVIDLAES